MPRLAVNAPQRSFEKEMPMNSYKMAIEEKARAAGIELVSDLTTNGELIPQITASHNIGFSPSVLSDFDGDKFFGGFGSTKILTADYWTLRERSNQLFHENPFARGIIRRLITNEINTGLTPEAIPEEEILGLPEDSLNDWTENVENRFGIWGKTPELCDWHFKNTFGDIQRTARREAFIDGDVLVVLRHSRITKLPLVQLISGGEVQTPFDIGSIKNGHEIRHGVELDNSERVVAHWVRQKDGSSKRIPAFGGRSGRKISWLVYGTDKRHDAIRGEPLLSIILQSLKEIDRYRDSTQRKALINSLLAMQVIKKEDKPGTLPLTGGAVRRDQASVSGTKEERKLNIANYVPGLVVDELQHGEEIKLMGGSGTDINYGPFEEAIIQGLAWAIGIPPEILRLSFSSNYSASQAAINEFRTAINLTWGDFGETFCSPVYIDWLISEVLLQKISAPSLLEAWRNPEQYDIFGAWIASEWYGSSKPSADPLKQVKASIALVGAGLSTNAREARSINGSKFSKNMKRLKHENELKAETMRPLAEFKREFEESTSEGDDNNSTDLELVEDLDNEDAA